jgi:serine/threonine-protein kinase
MTYFFPLIATTTSSSVHDFCCFQGTNALIAYPSAIAIDLSGNLVIADSTSYSVRLVTPSGLVTTIAGRGSGALVDGNGTKASVGAPYGVTIDHKYEFW